VGGNERGSRLARREERADEPLVRRDEVPQPDRDRVRGQVGLLVVVGQLDAGDDEQAVERKRPLRLGVDRAEVRGEIAAVDAGLGESPGVVRAQDVVRDAEDVEPGVPNRLSLPSDLLKSFLNWPNWGQRKSISPAASRCFVRKSLS
jgi:hypothetical protein